MSISVSGSTGRGAQGVPVVCFVVLTGCTARSYRFRLPQDETTEEALDDASAAVLDAVDEISRAPGAVNSENTDTAGSTSGDSRTGQGQSP